MSSHVSRRRKAARAAVPLTAVALCMLGTGVASAHITTDPSEVTRGEYNQIAFRVPNESATASTVKVTFTLPTDIPITSVRTAPLPGWKAEVAKGKIDPPVTIGNTAVTESVRTVTWTADPGNGVAPGQFGLFQILTGSIPDIGDTLVIPAVEIYSDGTIVNWDQPPTTNGEEPDKPAPVVKLTGAAGEGHGAPAASPPTSGGSHSEAAASSAGQDDTARWLAGAGLLVGALGLGAGTGAILRGRRRTAPSSTDRENTPA
jgi:uncharacterized protein YcnI